MCCVGEGEKERDIGDDPADVSMSMTIRTSTHTRTSTHPPIHSSSRPPSNPHRDPLPDPLLNLSDKDDGRGTRQGIEGARVRVQCSNPMARYVICDRCIALFLVAQDGAGSWSKTEGPCTETPQSSAPFRPRPAICFPSFAITTQVSVEYTGLTPRLHPGHLCGSDT